LIANFDFTSTSNKYRAYAQKIIACGRNQNSNLSTNFSFLKIFVANFILRFTNIDYEENFKLKTTINSLWDFYRYINPRKEGELMTVKLVGYANLDFSSKDGDVKGTHLYLNLPDPDVIGMSVAKVWAKDGFELPQLIPGNEYDADFNQKGKLVAIRAVQQQGFAAVPTPTPAASKKQ